MGRKNKDYDMEEVADKVCLEDFIVPQKIVAFREYYKPVPRLGLNTIAFTDAKLREFFKAYITKVGDPLAVYVERLENLGFKMQVSILGEPAILVEER